MPLFNVRKQPKPINYDPVAAKIQQRRYQMLVHAYCYYELDEPRISDADWDRWANELHKLQTDNPDLAAKCKFAKEFKNFDPSTGFDLPYNTPEIKSIVERLKYYGRCKNDS